MPFRCPQCHTPDTLDLILSIELPPDRRCDEISLQVIGCSACGFRGLAVYEELIRGAEADAWRHIGYRVSRDAVESVLVAIRSCPDPFNSRCECPAHTSLGEKNVYGMWSGLLELERGQTFSMRLYHGAVEPPSAAGTLENK